MTARTSFAWRVIGAGLCAAAVFSSPIAFAPPAAGAAPTKCRSFADVEQLVQAQATRRESTLDALVTALHARHDPFNLNGTQVGALQQAKSGITSLATTVQNGCYATRAAIAQAAQPMYTQYRVYWLRVPQSRVIQAADYLAEARSRLGDAAAKLSPLVKGSTKATTDLNEMTVALASADANLGVAPNPSASISTVAGLAPAVDMSANVTAIDNARTNLLAARSALMTARADAQQVLADLDAS